MLGGGGVEEDAMEDESRVAVESRIDRSFQSIALSDARSTQGLEEAPARRCIRRGSDRHQPYGRVAVARQDDLLAGFGAPDEVGQLRLGFADGNAP